MYTGIKFTNNASTQLHESITAADTVLVVDNNAAAVFPKLASGDYCMLTLADVSTHYEVVKCTSRTDSTLTVVRGQEGTTARAFPAGALLELRLSADSITRVSEDASVVKPHASSDSSVVGMATGSAYGHTRLNDEFDSTDSAALGVACTPAAFQKAIARLLAISTVHTITESQTWVAPEDATYTVTAVGGGGAGGNGGGASEGTIFDYWGWATEFVIGSGSGAGGGGAGQVITKTVKLNKGDTVQITIGGSGGTTKFGTHITALGGGRGNDGGGCWGCGCNCGNNNDWSFYGPEAGGTGGYSYGSPAATGSMGTSGSYSYRTCNGGVGGAGGVSIEGTFGNGGKGGDGQGIRNPQAGCSTEYFGTTTGAQGTIGCVKITVKLGA